MKGNEKIRETREDYSKKLQGLQWREGEIKSAFQQEAKKVLVGRMVNVRRKSDIDPRERDTIRVKDVLPLEGFNSSFKIISEVGTEIVVDENCTIEVVE